MTWGGFIRQRKRPTIEPKQHGNWRHGAYSKEVRHGSREVRAAIRALRGRGTLPAQSSPLGWRGFIQARG